MSLAGAKVSGGVDVKKIIGGWLWLTMMLWSTLSIAKEPDGYGYPVLDPVTATVLGSLLAAHLHRPTGPVIISISAGLFFLALLRTRGR